MTWLIPKQKPKGYWNYETCKEESKKYNRRNFQINATQAYIISLKNSWLDDFFPKKK